MQRIVWKSHEWTLARLVMICATFAAMHIARQPPARAEVQTEKHDGKITVTIDGELFTEYIFEGFSNPILYPVIGPTGIGMTRNYPMKGDVRNEAKDHPHHKSLWFTHGDVNGVDFWLDRSRRDGYRLGRIVQKEIELTSSSIATRNDWIGPDDGVICSDNRVIRFGTFSNGRYIDYNITIHASAGDVTFGDTKEGTMGLRMHPMLRLRADRDIDQKVAGTAINSEGIKGGEVWGKRARWVDYWAPIDGETVGIAIFDHPSNPRHPTWWHARTYGLFTANPFGIHDFERKPDGTGDMTVRSGDSVPFRYRFVFHKGDVNEADIEGEYAKYAQ